jgi:hypothetical protein
MLNLGAVYRILWVCVLCLSNPQKDVRKAVCNKTQRKTKNEMAGDVSTDLRKMGINEWSDTARDREAWRRSVRGAKAPGCSAIEVRVVSSGAVQILSTAPQLSISQKALETLPKDGNVMPKHVGSTTHS